jgi:hypothetical protein
MKTTQGDPPASMLADGAMRATDLPPHTLVAVHALQGCSVWCSARLLQLPIPWYRCDTGIASRPSPLFVGSLCLSLTAKNGYKTILNMCFIIVFVYSGLLRCLPLQLPFQESTSTRTWNLKCNHFSYQLALKRPCKAPRHCGTASRTAGIAPF